MPDLANLKRKVAHYKEILVNTIKYREVWEKSLRDQIVAQIESMCKEIELPVKVTLKEDIENLETIIVSLGSVRSGLFQKISADIHRDLIKSNGSLVYQQLFNGKIIVLISYPFIEGYGEAKAQKTIAIYRPEEIKPPFIIRHLEDFVKELTLWEDYDDDDSRIQQIGYQLNTEENQEPT